MNCFIAGGKKKAVLPFYVTKVFEIKPFAPCGSKQTDIRTRSTEKAVFRTALSMACPNLYIRIFMSPTPEILQTAPSIVRVYALLFLLLPFNIFSTYYFQAIMRAKAAFIVSVARGLVVSGVLIMALPALAGADSLWFAMPVTELLVMLYAASATVKYTRAL